MLLPVKHGLVLRGCRDLIVATGSFLYECTSLRLLSNMSMHRQKVFNDCLGVVSVESEWLFTKDVINDVLDRQIILSVIKTVSCG